MSRRRGYGGGASAAEEKNIVDLYGPRGGTAADLSTIEEVRRRRYLIRKHYADPGRADDGMTDCPLYYASLEGLGLGQGETLASLKNLPKYNAPSDYRMVDMCNFVPTAVDTDVGCMLNGFNWSNLRVLLDGTVEPMMTKMLQEILEHSEAEGGFSLAGILREGASAGDVYVCVEQDGDSPTGVEVHCVAAEFVFPEFEPLHRERPVSTRVVFQQLLSQGSGPQGQAPFETGAYSNYVCRFRAHGKEHFENGILAPSGRRSNPEDLDEPAIIHIPYRKTGDFFGAPAIGGDVLAAIDNANVAWSNLDNVMMQSFGVPVLFLFGVSAQADLSWGRRLVKGLPKDAKAEILSFEGTDNLLKVVEDKEKQLRSRIPQLVLHEVRGAPLSSSGVSLAIRLFSYDVYLSDVERQYTRGLNDLARVCFKTLGLWPKRGNVVVDVDWGDRFPQDTIETIKEMESSFKYLGKTAPIVNRFARKFGFRQQDIDEITKDLARQNEAEMQKKEVDASGGGLPGAAMADKKRQAAVATVERVAARDAKQAGMAPRMVQEGGW